MKNLFKTDQVITNIKKYYLIFCLLISSCAPAIAQAIDVDDETKSLIVDSMSLELIQNPSLRDPVDDLPLGVDYTNLMINGMSEQINISDSSKLVTYEVIALVESVSGEQGSILCSAFIRASLDMKVAEKANCYLNNPLQDEGSLDDEDEGILIDEL